MPRLKSRIDTARERVTLSSLSNPEIDPSGTKDLSLVRNILYRDRVSLVKTSRRRSILDLLASIFSIEVIDRARTSAFTRFKFIVSLSTSGRSSYTRQPFSFFLFVINVSEERFSSKKVSRKNTYARRGREFCKVRSPCSLQRGVRLITTSRNGGGGKPRSRIRADSFSISATSSPTLPRRGVHGFRVRGSRYLGRHYTDCVPGSTRLADY